MRTFGLLLLAAASAHAGDVVLPLPPEDQQKINQELGTGVVGQALPSKPIQDVSTYLPLQDRALTYHVTSGPNGGKTQTLGLAKVRRPMVSRPGGLCFRPPWPDLSVRRPRAI
jgi:hypothetical protein